jgi:transposase
MLYLGIDQHAKQLTISLRNEAGDVLQARQVSTQPEKVHDYLQSLKSLSDDGFVAIVEVCGFNDWLLEMLPNYGCSKVALIQPEKKKLIKTDKRDAKGLSELLWLNRQRIARGESVRGVRQVVLPSQADLENQRLTKVRQQLARRQTKIVCQIKHILRRYNLQWSMPTKTFPSKKAIVWLKSLKLSTWDRQEMNWHLGELELLPVRMSFLDVEIAKRMSGNDSAAILLTIPGCGNYTALALQSRIGNAHRFARGRSIANYFGLTPRVSDSGEGTGRRGSITKAGNATVRWLLAQMVVHVLRQDEEMKKWYKSIRTRRGSKVARVAVMRRLCPVIRNMMIECKDYWSCRKSMLERRDRQRYQELASKRARKKTVNRKR